MSEFSSSSGSSGKWAAVLVAILCALLVDCAEAPRANAEDARTAFVTTIPTCKEARECEGMWTVARKWVASWCGMEIRTMTDSLIETYDSPMSGTKLACRVSKDSLPAGGYKFTVSASCANWFRCDTNAHNAMMNFNAKLREAGDAAVAHH